MFTLTRHRTPGLALVLFFVSGLSAQDTLFFGAMGDTVRALVECDRYIVRSPDPQQQDRTLAIEHTRSGRLLSEERTILNEENKRVPDGTSRWFREDGSIKVIMQHVRGQRLSIQSFWPGGEPKRDDLFQNDSLVSGRCFAEDGSEVEYFPYLIEPGFQGGLNKLYEFLRGHLRYPDQAFEDGIQGTVMTRFVVMKDGAIEQAEVIRKVSPDLDAEALRVVRKMPAWSPGLMDGEPVKCRFNLPVAFKLRSIP